MEVFFLCLPNDLDDQGGISAVQHAGITRLTPPKTPAHLVDSCRCFAIFTSVMVADETDAGMHPLIAASGASFGNCARGRRRGVRL